VQQRSYTSVLVMRDRRELTVCVRNKQLDHRGLNHKIKLNKKSTWLTRERCCKPWLQWCRPVDTARWAVRGSGPG